MEIWKDIIGYEGYYQVSNLGRIMNVRRNKLVKSHIKKKTGYYDVALSLNGKQKRFLVHRLVAMAFIPNHDNKETVNHQDGDKSNNTVGNLEWHTNKENTNHAIDSGLRKSKLTEEDYKYIRNNFEEYGASALADKFGVHTRTIQKIADGTYAIKLNYIL